MSRPWTGSKPLAGKRILVTRARHQASQLAAELELLGAETLVIPAIEIMPTESYDPLDRALQGIMHFEWIIFTSANAVRVFGERMRLLGTPAASLEKLKIAAIGPATARAIQELGLETCAMPERYVAESLVDSLGVGVAGCRVLLVRAKIARDVIPVALCSLGATVDIAEAYQNVVPVESVAALQRAFVQPDLAPHAVTFTSSSSARNFFTLMDEAAMALPRSMVLASIGPITSATLRELGCEPQCEAEQATVAGLAQAVAEYFQQSAQTST